MKILMRDDAGAVTETIEDVHVCRGEHDHCEAPAICEDCGHEASPEWPVYVFTTADDMTFWACAQCLAVDDYCTLVQG